MTHRIYCMRKYVAGTVSVSLQSSISSYPVQGRDASDQHIIEVVLKMLQGERIDLNIHL